MKNVDICLNETVLYHLNVPQNVYHVSGNVKQIHVSEYTKFVKPNIYRNIT